jgi:AAA domain
MSDAQPDIAIDVAAEEPVQAVAAPVVKAPCIKSFTLCDFRAFAGSAPVTFELDGKNLLIFGENGAGKSSVFHALDAFFAVPTSATNATTRKKLLSTLTNRFSEKKALKCKVIRDFWDEKSERQVAGNVIEVSAAAAKVALEDGGLELIEPAPSAYVEVEFDNNATRIRWDGLRHPVDTEAGADQIIVRAAYCKTILDYRALLDTNYRHGTGTINLFDVCVNTLLRDFPIVHLGKPERLFDLWRQLQDYLARGQLRKREIGEINALAVSFGTGLRDALDQLRPKVDELLIALGWKDLKLTALTTPGITYNQAASRDDRDFSGKEILPVIEFRGYAPDAPQNFLNEARLSALGLSIYLAGRKICANTVQADTPRVMVLDDVLIGLDQSNRIPVLDLLADKFKDWQVILLTHDRVWFEMARAYHRRHSADKFWRYVKIHSNDDPTRAPTVTDVGSSAANEASKDAQFFLDAGHINAAGNYARIATELGLREFCETKKIYLAYQQQPDKIPASELLIAAQQYSKSKCNGQYDNPLKAIDMYSTILLNQLSHGGVPAVTQHEVQGAIVAVKGLLFSVKVMPAGLKQET